MSRDKYKRKMIHVPKFCSGFYIKFQSLEDRDTFINSDEFKFLMGEGTTAAKNAKCKLISFWNPD